MAIANTVRNYLTQKGVEFDVVIHSYTPSSMQTAESAHVPGDQLAKAVVLKDREGYLMAVTSATRKVDVEALRSRTHRKLELAEEDEIMKLFTDCELGAIPAVGPAYGVDVMLDDSIEGLSDIYFEAGDHVELVHMSGSQFKGLMPDAGHGRFSYHV